MPGRMIQTVVWKRCHVPGARCHHLRTEALEASLEQYIGRVMQVCRRWGDKDGEVTYSTARLVSVSYMPRNKGTGIGLGFGNWGVTLDKCDYLATIYEERK